MPFIQDLIHKLEVGPGMRHLRTALLVTAPVLLLVCYNLRAFKNMSTQEAMDSAQVARNLSEGKGFTTLFVRPFSMHLVSRHNRQSHGITDLGKPADLARLKAGHPDLANPPVYPVVLAGLMKLCHFDYTASVSKPFWSKGGEFYRYKPDFVIGLFNQILLFGLAVAVFFLARRLFDPAVALLSAVLVLGTELFWRFSVSGLSTILLMLIFAALVWVLVLLEAQVREPKWGPASAIILAGLAGAIVGVGGLTRYAFGWLIVPLLIYLIVLGGSRRTAVTLTALVAFLAVMSPWVVRNYQVSGTPFGTAGYALLEDTFLFPGNQLQRSLEPNFNRWDQVSKYGAASGKVLIVWLKLVINARKLVPTDLPKLGGTWVSAFFLAGLLVTFRSPAIRRLRWFLLGCLAVLALAQTLGRTQLSEESPEVNTENLLVVVAPLVLVYGVSLFYMLLDQMQLPILELRYAVIGLFALVACLPMILTFLPPRTQPLSWPYNPARLEEVAEWLNPNETAMSDMPWAFAWYGHRQCLWLTLKASPDAQDPATHEDFLSISDYQKPINLLYLTPETMDKRFLSEWLRAGEGSWAYVIFQIFANGEVPPTFPLRQMPVPAKYRRALAQYLAAREEVILSDWERWKR